LKKLFIKNFIVLTALFGLFVSNTALGFEFNYPELDSIRAQLACQNDKNSAQYLKIKQKLDKFVTQNKIDYTQNNRLNDSIRLINEQKYNAAIYELKALVEENYNVTRCLELLGDICIKANDDYSKAVKYYKKALNADSENVSASFKLAKAYLTKNKNILGLEYLKYTVERTSDRGILDKIEYILKNKIQPDDKFDINNMYEILADIYIRENRRQEAFVALNNALRVNPDDIYLKYYLGDLYYSVGEDRNASFVYDAILSENPNDSGIRTSRAKALYREGDFSGADSEYRKMLKQNPKSIQALYGLYKIYENKLPADKILQKIYSDVPNYSPSRAEAIKFAKIMEKTNDVGAVNTFIVYAQELDRVEKEKLEAQTKARELEKQKLQQIEFEKQQKIKFEQERLKKQKEAELKKKAEAEELRVKKLNEQNALAERLRDEKLRREEIAREEARIANEERLRKEQLAREEAKRIQEEKLRKEQDRKLELQRIQEEKRLEQQRLAEEKRIKAEELRQKKLAELEKQKEQERIKAEQKRLEQQRLAEEKRIKEQQLTEQKRLEQQKLAEKKALEQKLLAEKKQKEYEDRTIEAERQKSIQKDPATYNKAKAAIEKYSKDNPKTAQTYVAIANAYKMSNQPMSAIRNYKEAMKLDPTNSDIYYNLGLTYMELNSFITARANLVKSVNLDKNNTKAINLLSFVNQKIVTGIINNAFSKFEKKEYIAAYDILNSGIKDFPSNSQLYYYRGLVADAMNRNAAQIMDLNKAVELDPSNRMAFYQLGKAYEKINDERNALVAYERFLSTEPDEKELVDEIQKKVIKLGEKYY